MLSTDGNDISLTRGDTAFLTIALTKKDGTAYEPVEGDVVSFALKKSYKDATPLVVKQIPTDTMVLEIEPDDTKNLAFAKYDYDIELTDYLGHVSTPIVGTLTLTKEVH